MNQYLEKVQAALENYVADDGSQFTVTADQSDDVDMLTIIKEDLEEFAILATSSETQLLFNAALFDEGQVEAENITEMHQMMLELNMAMPLSSFAKTGSMYSVFGAMSVESTAEHIQEEVDVLSENIIDALEVCENFLKSE